MGIMGVIYKGMALGLVFQWGASLVPVTRTRLNNKINICGFVAAINNLLDECFFDPTKFQVNEYVLLLLILLILIRSDKVVRVA
jgi:hypothetical protein